MARRAGTVRGRWLLWTGIIAAQAACDSAKVADRNGERSVVQPIGRFVAADEVAISQPARIAASPDGSVFVSEPTAGVVLHVTDGKIDFGIVDLDQPLGVAIRGDLLLVGNAGRGSVDVYSVSERKYLRSLGSGAGEFAMPNDLAAAPDGEIYVADSKANVVRMYRLDGTSDGSFGALGDGLGAFRFPVAVAVDGERVVVGDQGNHRVQVFDRHGAFVSSFGEPLPMSADTGGTAPDLAGRFTRIQGVVLDGERIDVLDSFHSTVQAFDLAGRALGFSGRRGACEGCFGLGLGLTLAAPGRVIVTDPDHHRLVSFNAAGGLR